MEVEQPKWDYTIFISTSHVWTSIVSISNLQEYTYMKRARHNKVALEATPFTNPHTHLHVVSTYMYSVFQTRN